MEIKLYEKWRDYGMFSQEKRRLRDGITAIFKYLMGFFIFILFLKWNKLVFSLVGLELVDSNYKEEDFC